MDVSYWKRIQRTVTFYCIRSFHLKIAITLRSCPIIYIKKKSSLDLQGIFYWANQSSVLKLKFSQVLPMNDGKPCPNELIRHKKCKIRCAREEKKKRDCLMSTWSEWSSCSKTCGVGAVQHRTRNVLVHPRGGGRKCPYRVEKRTCPFIFCDAGNNV